MSLKNLLAFCLILTSLFVVRFGHADESYRGRYYSGRGDVDYIRLLDTAYRMYCPDPELQNISMLYEPSWNGFVEGPTWDAWWVQNSYGASFCQLPFLQEPYVTFLNNANDLWYGEMGDGKRKGAHDWVGPDGCLCDAARPGWVVYKQGDCRIDIHDWGMEFTAAGSLIQMESLLVSRDMKAIRHYLPMIERSLNFIESRRDPKTNLFLAGPAGNLLAPSFAGWQKPDGTFDTAYLTGLSISYIGALDRFIELQKMVGDKEKAELFTNRRDLAKQGLSQLTTEEGYFIKSLDPDGTKHGVYGAEKHGYFEAVCNHDAVALRIVDEEQAKKIYEKIRSIPGLRPHDLIITNYPGLDDTYETSKSGLWQFGTWVDGGHWTTCEARMMIAYYRVGAYDDARRSMKKIEAMARNFKTDNPLVEFGNAPYQPNLPINCVYDSWGAPAALIRGLFEYLYRADSLVIVPHIPTGITQLEQNIPIRFGTKKIFISTSGNGKIQSVFLNGSAWDRHDEKIVTLPYESMPDLARLHVVMQGGNAGVPEMKTIDPVENIPAENDPFWNLAEIHAELVHETPYPPELQELGKIGMFLKQLREHGFGDSYEAKHARLIVDYVSTLRTRQELLESGKIAPLAPASQEAANQLYFSTMAKLIQGLKKTMQGYQNTTDPRQKTVFTFWADAMKEANATETEGRILVGVDYFAGWWKPLPNKWTGPDGKDWREKYPERVPLLGQYNEQETMDHEIVAASGHGVDFFLMLWYFNGIDNTQEREKNARFLNVGVEQFMKSPNAARMKFAIEYCNHEPYQVIDQADWDWCVKTWVEAMKHPGYLRVGGKPLFKVHSWHHYWFENKENMDQCIQRLQQLRQAARDAGLGEMLIGAGIGSYQKITNPEDRVAQLFDFTSTYMELPPDLPLKTGDDYPYETLAEFMRGSRKVHGEDAIPFLPYFGLNFNAKPWGDHRARFQFPTREQLKEEFQLLKSDLENPSLHLGVPLENGKLQKIFTIYAWNEFGEGGFLAPTEGEKTIKLEAIREVFSSENVE